MREILFKGEWKWNGAKVEGDLIQRKNGPYIRDRLSGKAYRVDLNTVSEFTGFEDKNGKKIFEGDIIKVTDDDGDTDFEDGGIGNVIFLNGMWYVDGAPQNSLNDLNHCYYIEVVGSSCVNQDFLGSVRNDAK